MSADGVTVRECSTLWPSGTGQENGRGEWTEDSARMEECTPAPWVGTVSLQV